MKTENIAEKVEKFLGLGSKVVSNIRVLDCYYGCRKNSGSENKFLRVNSPDT